MHTLRKNGVGRVIIVGDVHGCLVELDNLLAKVRFRKEIDTLVFVGDFVNKGPDSIGVIRRAMQLGAKGVLGNHDFYALEKYDMLLRGEEDPDSPDQLVQVARNMPKDCYDWLCALPHILEIPQYKTFVIHAGIDPAHSVRSQKLWTLLHVRRVLADGSCTDEGMMGVPWATLWKGPETIIFGHDARSGLQQHSYAIGLDTGCVYGTELTAYVFPQGEFVSVPGYAGYKKGGSKKREENGTPIKESPPSQPEQGGAVAELLARFGLRTKASASPEPLMVTRSPPILKNVANDLLFRKQPDATPQPSVDQNLTMLLRQKLNTAPASEAFPPAPPRPAEANIQATTNGPTIGDRKHPAEPAPGKLDEKQPSPETARGKKVPDHEESLVKVIRNHAIKVVAATKSGTAFLDLMSAYPLDEMRDEILEDPDIPDSVFCDIVSALSSDLETQGNEKMMWIRDIVLTRETVRTFVAATTTSKVNKHIAVHGSSILLRSLLSALRG